MSKYQKYAEYKDSEIVWMGNVPSHWTSERFKWLLAEKLKTSNCDLPAGSISFGEVVYKNEDNLSPDTKASYQEVLKDEFLINPLNLNYDLKSLRTALSKINVVVSTGYIVLHCNKSLDKKYVRWLLHEFDVSHMKTLGAGVRQTVNFSDIANSYFYLPTNIEQKQIAHFLDHETAKIDSLIAKQEKLIELLKEKRQAVISYAVTEGLDPNVAMKDSGVEWLGEVPEHWRVCRLKHVGYIQSGIAKGKDLKDKISISVPMLRVANVQDGYLNLDEVHQIDIEPEQLERYLLQNGDVLMNEGGDNDKLGRGAVWRNEIKNCIHQNHVFAIRTTLIEPEWLDILTRASYAKFHFFRQSKQSTNLASISATNIKETPILVPPKNEREQILSYLNKQFDRFSKLENRCYQQIELLKERRTALISSAVTGKIDVRHWQNSNKNNNQNNRKLSA
ncbi:restriction endonuclease subunit S [Acinetobacter pittii]|uniref:restriction endonuclease subunit S n=1 Tax=Acinetobacter pittii TaxID=48296 RepID=UPI001981D3CC|nr:restriction endonuclease subunit S [Acinetobacter pittii]MBN6521235.1 restriction endonuclease subunit S [Acinetobacter pittii]